MEFNITDADILTNINAEFRRKIWPVSAFVGFEILLGLVGNSFVLYVFGVRYTSCTYRCFVVYLGFIDIISCFTTMPAEIVSEMFWYIYSFPVICKIKSFFNAFTVSADVLCLITIAIDSYKRTCVPTAIQIEPALAIYLCFGITLTAIGLAVPAGIAGGLTHFNYTYNETNISVTVCGVSDVYEHSRFIRVYHIALQLIICLSLVPMFLLCMFISRSVCCKNTEVPAGERETVMRQHLINNDEENYAGKVTRQQTLLLSLISLLFIVTIVTYLVFLDYFKRKKAFSLDETVTYLFFFRLYFINHVINPFIYGWFDPQFRRIFRSMFTCRKS